MDNLIGIIPRGDGDVPKMIDFPKTIKGTTQSYGIIEKGKTEADYPNTIVEIPIEDIASFTLIHETYKNGLQLRANIKKELVSSYYQVKAGEQADNTGCYRRKYDFINSFTIRTKDEPKLSKLLRKELMASKTIVVHTGINAGTPIAQSFSYGKKELKTNELSSEKIGVDGSKTGTSQDSAPISEKPKDE